MELSNICVIIFGLLISATAEKVSNDIWNVKSYDDYEVVELEKQFETDWNSLQDPLDWMKNEIETPQLDESTEEGYDEIDESYVDDTETTDGNALYGSETEEDFMSSSEDFEATTEDSMSSPEYYEYSSEDSMSPSEDSVSTSEEYDSTSYSLDSSEYEDSSNLTSEESSDESDSDSETNENDGQRLRGIRKRKRMQRKGKRREKKPWIKRKKAELGRNKRRFRNPHGAKEQIPHPPKTGRWYRVWQRFNNSKPAREGRWAAMYNRTRPYWNRNRNGERILDESTDSEDSSPERQNGVRGVEHKHKHPQQKRNHPHRVNASPGSFRNHTHSNESLGLRRIHQRFGLHKKEHMKPAFKRRWLQNKVGHVCEYLASPRHKRYMQHKRNRTRSGDYRLDFADQMSLCCDKEYEERLNCFRDLTRARVDEYCSSNSTARFRPWELGQRRRAVNRIKPKCCLPKGEARYDCFNRTHQILLKHYNTTTPTTAPQTEEVVVQELPVLRTVTSKKPKKVQNKRKIRRERKQHRSNFKSSVKTTCCNLGKEYGVQVDENDSAPAVCNKLARKLSHKYRPKLICHMAMGRCCINEARKHRERAVQVDSEKEQEIGA